MMRQSALFTAIATLLLCAEAQAQHKKPVFAFMGDNTATQTRRTSLAGKPCIVKGRRMECGPSDPVTWLGTRLNFVSSTYWDGRLIRAVGAFDRAQLAKVRARLVKTYGKPQNEGYQTMAERLDPFTYPETMWEFDDGRLDLDSAIDDSAVLTFRFSVDYPPDDVHVIRVPVP